VSVDAPAEAHARDQIGGIFWFWRRRAAVDTSRRLI
jgi:hypothetical protein